MIAKNKKEKESGKPKDKFTIVTEELYKVLCETIQNLLQSSIVGEGITEQEIETAREFAELKPDTKAAKELLEFLERGEIKEAIKTSMPGLR